MPTGQVVAPSRHRLGGAIDAANRLDRQHGMQAGPAAQSLQVGRLGADEDPATNKTTVTTIELIENSPARRISINAGAGEVSGYRLMCLAVIALLRRAGRPSASCRAASLGDRPAATRFSAAAMRSLSSGWCQPGASRGRRAGYPDPRARYIPTFRSLQPQQTRSRPNLLRSGPYAALFDVSHASPFARRLVPDFEGKCAHTNPGQGNGEISPGSHPDWSALGNVDFRRCGVASIKQ